MEVGDEMSDDLFTLSHPTLPAVQITNSNFLIYFTPSSSIHSKFTIPNTSKAATHRHERVRRSATRPKRHSIARHQLQQRRHSPPYDTSIDAVGPRRVDANVDSHEHANSDLLPTTTSVGQHIAASTATATTAGLLLWMTTNESRAHFDPSLACCMRHQYATIDP